MARNKDFAASLIDDYVGLGFGERVNELTIRSEEGVELELDTIESSETGENIGIQVFTDGTQVAELNYDDENFNEKLLSEVVSALNL